MGLAAADDSRLGIKKPKGLSPRISWLRDYYFKGAERAWNNEFTAWTTGTPWDILFNEITYYIVPETYLLLQTMGGSFRQAARNVDIPDGFFNWSLVERRAWFVKEVMVNHVPMEVLPGDLLAGARFNVQTSMCFTRKESKEYNGLVTGKNGARKAVKEFHDHGYGNAGATSGHLIPGYARILETGWKGIYDELSLIHEKMDMKERNSPGGCQIRAMMTAALMPGEAAEGYSRVLEGLGREEKDGERKNELLKMAENLRKVPWEPAENFWEAVQSLWLTHMLVMSDENYPGPGVSFGRLDQYLFPFWKRSMEMGMDREFGKEILRCFWIHCNTAYDAMIRNGHHGITAGFGQLITLSGLGKDGKDMTNDLTLAILEVIDEMSPILEPKPNVRIHRNTPDELLSRIVDMISTSQGAPFLLNFDERSMAGMMRQADISGEGEFISRKNVYEYAPVGCLENTMAGNDRSGTVDNNINLLKAVELALTGGKDLLPFTDIMTGKTFQPVQIGPETGDPGKFETWEEFFRAYKAQTAFIIKKCVDLYEKSESIRARFFPTPYLSCLVRGCAEKRLDITRGGAEINHTTMEGVTFATTVDSLLAIKYLVFDSEKSTMDQIVQALRNNWKGYEALQAMAVNRAPKYGRDDDMADELGRAVMGIWCDEVWKYTTKSTGRRFRPGMLSWNYWAGDGFVMAASADGRKQGQFLSNAICPSNGADVSGPTANTNSVGKVLGGRPAEEEGDFGGYVNYLPNGASHTITFNPSLLKDPDHKEKFKAFLRGYCENGGTALQINVLDSEMLRDAQKHPEKYSSLLVRITGYNAYFTTVGRELQNEVIHRVSHCRF